MFTSLSSDLDRGVHHYYDELLTDFLHITATIRGSERLLTLKCERPTPKTTLRLTFRDMEALVDILGVKNKLITYISAKFGDASGSRFTIFLHGGTINIGEGRDLTKSIFIDAKTAERFVDLIKEAKTICSDL